jgi:hypothetical protein
MRTELDLKAWAEVECRFGCNAPPIGIFHVPEGCHCWPDTVQALCAQHAVKAESKGSMTLLVGDWPT